MKFSVVLTCALAPGADQTETIRRTLRYAQEAEKAGYQGVWLLEHHFTPYGLCPSPLTMASYILGQTTRLRVGTAVCVLPLYHPVRFAEDVALIDQMSGGRLDVGVSRGGGERDFQAFGVDPGRNHLITREWLDIAERAWRGENIEQKSDFIELPPAQVNPQPLAGRPPLYLACQSPSSVEMAAERNMGMLLSYWLQRENIVSQIELYEETRTAAGLPPVEHAAACIAFPADSREEALDAVRPHLSWWRKEAQEVFFALEKLRLLGNYDHQVREWEREIVGGRAASDGTVQDSSVDKLLDLNPVGTVGECVDKLGSLAEDTGIGHFMCGFEGPAEEGPVIEAMWRFAEEVAPQLQTPESAALS
ncbi:LLM class flavin-dependent oxidoreductase [Nocardia takedensis]